MAPRPEFYKWVVEIEIDPTWVADGFNLTNERLHDMIMSDLTYAYEHEVRGNVLQAPDPNQIKCEQGHIVPGYKPRYEE